MSNINQKFKNMAITTKSKTKIWLSYDLGINGDYQNLYTWLDSYKAEECGDSMAIIKDYSFNGDLIKAVIKDIKRYVTFRKRDRLYLICTKPILARFIIGGRKRSAWVGYSNDTSEQNDI